MYGVGAARGNAHRPRDGRRRKRALGGQQADDGNRVRDENDRHPRERGILDELPDAPTEHNEQHKDTLPRLSSVC